MCRPIPGGSNAPPGLRDEGDQKTSGEGGGWESDEATNYAVPTAGAERSVVGNGQRSRYEDDLGGVLSMFFRFSAGEMTVPSDAEFDPKVHLCVSDIALDDCRRPGLLRIIIKQSKTDPFRKGVALFVGRTGTTLCPIAALLDYLVVRGSAPGPLFSFADANAL